MVQHTYRKLAQQAEMYSNGVDIFSRVPSTSVIFHSFEDVLKTVGAFGPFQINKLIFVQLMTVVFAANVVFMPFSTYVPEIRCMKADNSSVLFHKDHSEPFCAALPSCLQLKWTAPFYTIIEEWRLVCSQDYIPQMINSIFQSGSVVGVITAGPLADRFGRKTLFLCSFAVSITAGFASSLANTWQLMAALRFVVGGSHNVMNVGLFIWSLETCSSDQSVIMNLGSLWAFSYIASSGLGYCTANWRTFLLVQNSIAILLFLYSLLYLVESPRWLVQKGRFSEAAKVLSLISQRNGQIAPKNITPENLSNIPIESSETKKKLVISKIFQSRKLTKCCVLLVLLEVTANVGVDLFVMQISQMSGSPFLKFTIFGSLRLWVPFAIFYTMRLSWFGRRQLVLIPLFIIFVAYSIALMAVLLQFYANTIILVSSMISGIIINFLWTGLGQYQVELLPTTVRNTASALIFFCNGIAGVFVPQLIYIEKFWAALPFFVICVITSITLCCAYLFLPETKGKPLLENTEEKTLV